MGALSLMDKPKYREGFGPFLDRCTVAEFNNPTSLQQAVNPSTAALLLECIQGEGGIRPVSADFVRALKALQRRFGFLLIADEIQSGLGRTGKFFGFQHFDLQPDLVLMAKPIGGGLPLGAILATDETASVLEPGMHGTTFGGNPVACAAGVATVSEIVEQNLISHAATVGGYLLDSLRSLQTKFPKFVKEVRGLGLMAGMDLSGEGDSIVGLLREKRILINCTDQTVLRFLPPLTIERDHVDITMVALQDALSTRT
jgi:acetylornithine aminotransferase/acetylornithine/N-succinyldiaminopimelate aminotransferase